MSEQPKFIIQQFKEQKDWDEFLPFFAKCFINSTFAKRYLPDVEKRKPFLQAYFRYQYKSHYSDDRAALLGIKACEEEGGKKCGNIVWGVVITYDTSISKGVDASEMTSVYPRGSENIIRREEWLEENIHAPIRELAADLGTAAWFAAISATLPEYNEITMVFLPKAIQQFRQQGMERHRRLRLPTKIPPFNYTFLIGTTPRALRRIEVWAQYDVVAHLHHNHTEGLKCYLDPTADDDGKRSCHLVVVPKSIAPIAKKYFQSSNL